MKVVKMSVFGILVASLVLFGVGLFAGFVTANYLDSKNPPRIVRGDWNADGEKDCGIAFKGKWILSAKNGEASH